MIEIIKASKIQFDIVVNNAGVMYAEDSMTKIPSLEYAKLVIETNLTGTMFLTKELLPFMSDKCRVVNVSSGLASL